MSSAGTEIAADLRIWDLSESYSKIYGWRHDGNRLADIRDFVAGPHTTDEQGIRAENFHWFLTRLVQPRFEHPTDAFGQIGLEEIIECVRELQGKTLITVERVAEKFHAFVGLYIFSSIGSSTAYFAF